MKLHIVHGTPAPDTPKERARKRVRDMDKPEYMLQCPRCGCREMMETVIGGWIKNGKLSGGSRTILCVDCHRKGERTVVA